MGGLEDLHSFKVLSVPDVYVGTDVDLSSCDESSRWVLANARNFLLMAFVKLLFMCCRWLVGIDLRGVYMIA